MKTENIFSVENKNVLITGCSAGIGLSIAEGFIKKKANVIGISRSKSPINSQLSDFFFCDLSLDTEIKKTTKLIKNKYKKIDVLINVAGVSIEIDKKNNLKNYDDTFKVNTRAVYHLINELEETLVVGSSVINFSSIGGVLGFPNNPYYGASKGAIISLSRALANDFGKKNIRVNCVLPGYFKTKMTETSYNNYDKRIQRENQTMLGRWGDPKELLGITIFLASEASSYITGVDIPVDGGWVNKGL